MTHSSRLFLPEHRTTYTLNFLIFQDHFLLTKNEICGKSGNVLPDSKDEGK